MHDETYSLIAENQYASHVSRDTNEKKQYFMNKGELILEEKNVDLNSSLTAIQRKLSNDSKGESTSQKPNRTGFSRLGHGPEQ